MHEGHRERMRDKYLQNGIGGLAPHEVLEMLLFFSQPRVNTNETAHRLLDTFDSLRGVLDADIEALCAVQGVGKNSAVLLHLVKDCFNLYKQGKPERAPTFETAMHAGNYMLDTIGSQTDEAFYVLCLDPSHRMLSMKKIFEGSAYRVHIDVRKIVEYALHHRAHSVILAHNHPIGPIEPSEDDIQLTKQIQAALSHLGISVIDHIIVGEEDFCSMAARCIL